MAKFFLFDYSTNFKHVKKRKKNYISIFEIINSFESNRLSIGKK